MIVKLWKYNGELKQVDKHLSDTPLEYEAVYAKHPVNLLRPEIRISGINTMTDISDYNYMWISTTRRYYFITSITTEPGHIKQIIGECDVLYSHRTEIKNSDQVITRQESQKDLYLPDDQFVFTSPKSVEIKQFGELITLNDDKFFIVTSGA